MTDLDSYARHARVWGCFSGDRTAELAFWETLARRYGSSILALMSATGEMAAALAERGFSVCAVDFIPEMIDEGRRRYGGIASLSFHQGDIRSLRLDRQDHDFAFASDFNHLLTRADCLAALIRVRQHLRQGGGLGLDLWRPADESWESPWREFAPTLTDANPVALDPAIQKTWKRGRTRYDANERLITIQQEVYIQQDGTVEQFSHHFTLKLWDPPEIACMLVEAGFWLANQYGSYQFDPFAADSPHWIVEAVKGSG